MPQIDRMTYYELEEGCQPLALGCGLMILALIIALLLAIVWEFI